MFGLDRIKIPKNEYDTNLDNFKKYINVEILCI